MKSTPMTYDEISIEASNNNEFKAKQYYETINKALVEHHEKIATIDGYCWHTPSEMDDNLANYIAGKYNDDPNMLAEYEINQLDGNWIRFTKYSAGYDH